MPEQPSLVRLRPPFCGDCHAAHCDQPSTLVVRVRRINGSWTEGVDYCEQHAHEAAQRMRVVFEVWVEAW